MHFVGIGGVGMSALARVLHAAGSAVDGCDRALGRTTETLLRAGIRCHLDHDPAHLRTATRVVVSSAIGSDEPEVLAAQRDGVPVVHRSELLAEVLAGHQQRVVVTGAHGKTTTTAMIAYSLDRLGLVPTSVVGGAVPQLAGNGNGRSTGVCVAEGDESDGSIVRLPADIAVILNVDLDHLDHYRSLADLVSVLARWTAELPRQTVLVAGDGVDLPTVRCVQRFGLGPGPGLRALAVDARPGGVSFRPSGFPRRVHLRLRGVHNAENACAAALALVQLGVPPADAFEALQSFRGVRRRFEIVGMRRGALVVDDYAHHPAELAALVAAGRSMRPARLAVYFQPHTAWRTSAFGSRFAEALAEADLVVVGETLARPGSRDAPVTARGIVERLLSIAPRIPSAFAADEDEAVELLLRVMRRGDVILCCDAAADDRVARRLVAEPGWPPGSLCMRDARARAPVSPSR
jgi:UDP-N-acetylmuramate--alanine ligase